MIESRNSITENSEKKKKFVFVKFKGLGCKGTSLPASTPAIIRSAAEWEANKRARNQNQKRRKTNKNPRNQENVAVDFPDVCCAPPGIGIASDFAPRARNNIASRSDHRKHSREARRNEADFPSIWSSVRASRTNNHQSAGEIIEMMMSQQPMLPGRHDRYRGWRLNVDDMSYEELLDLGDKIGYVGTGLQEEEIVRCLRKFKHFNFDSTSLLVADQKDWKCSICQEKCKRGDDIGALNCGHHHHIQCIKQWLLHKNTCPVCKSAVMPDRSN
ncbi:E3 ubiquitin-protein ligase mbr2 [Phtheirospermum japonicum]|uniref:RING-type E3 ubiquitin transferase n=1 Tax=Phtheirospermum japonicum TaxID=374723 RepID=A0A830BHT8_9LAMI|nr:E3 ubiquitin-protein ligase mbr2 [Phtheirospermum japonicum]